MTWTVEDRIRRLLLILSVLSFGVTTIELILQEHTGEPLQLFPFALCGVGGIAAVAALTRPQRSTLMALRWLMGAVAIGGMVGVLVHLQRNFAFEQEIRASAALPDMILNALKGASPLFAPGALVFAALLGLLATYAHPILEGQKSD
jgi:hypothetical protein